MKRIHEDMAYGDLPVAGSYWRTTVADDTVWPAVAGPVTCDFAVIGGGYTGLTAAFDLAEAGADVVLLEARRPGWGASGRNGGFCCLGGARLSMAQMVRRFGANAALEYHAAEHAAVDLVAGTLDRLAIEADTHSRGETLLAHSPAALADLHDRAEDLRVQLGISSAFLPREALAQEGMASPAFYGALTTPVGFALNPLKYALGLARAARRAGARVFAESPVAATKPTAGRWQLECPGGTVSARTILLATNGYSSENLPAWFAGRYLPVPSNILVSRELTDDELAAQGWTSRQMCYDTRHLLHYFRLMPNRRMLFGMRGAVRTTPADLAAARAATRADFERTFPAWQDVATPHFWSGLVAMSRGQTPYVGPVDGAANAYAGLCYHGNGVAMGSYAGGLLADLALGRPPRRPWPALMRAPLRRFPLGRFRRALLPLAYRWYRWRDGP